MCGDYKEKKAVFTERDIPVGYVSIITMYIVFMNSWTQKQLELCIKIIKCNW